MATDSADSFARPRAAAGVLFFDEQDRVMLVEPSYKDYRDIPGGYIRHGETPTQAAARETREELGISPPIGRLLVTDWAPNQAEGDTGVPDALYTAISPLQGGSDLVTFFVGVDDIKSVIEQVAKLGGRVVQEPRQAPGVSFALIADPQGHVVGLAQQG